MSEPAYTFACMDCGQRAFLYYGRCETCAPQQHAEFRVYRATWGAACDAFTRATGLDPLDDWPRFERWYDTVQPTHESDFTVDYFERLHG